MPVNRRRCGLALFGALSISLASLAGGCGTVKTPTEPVEPTGGPVFTFSQIQVEIFTPTCAKAACHDSVGISGGMILEAGQAYGNLVNQPAQSNSTFDRVEPGDPERSYIIKKLRGDPDITGERMPFDGPPYLSPEQIAGIAGWIRAGALNN
jgi:hypothetical protein